MSESELHRALDDAAKQQETLRALLQEAIEALEYYEQLSFGESDGGQTARAALRSIKSKL